jgi:hypothetical protein
MAERKMRYAVLTYFEKHSPIGNKARYQWDADNLLESYPYTEIKEVIDYYFKVTQRPSWQTFVYNYDSYKDGLALTIADKSARQKNRERLRKWMDDE